MLGSEMQRVGNKDGHEEQQFIFSSRVANNSGWQMTPHNMGAARQNCKTEERYVFVCVCLKALPNMRWPALYTASGYCLLIFLFSEVKAESGAVCTGDLGTRYVRMKLHWDTTTREE